MAELTVKSKRCRNAARWRWFYDKFWCGYREICTTCLLELYQDGLSHAELMSKPWLIRRRCGMWHPADYAKSIEAHISFREELYWNGDGRKDSLVVSDGGCFRSFVTTGTYGESMNYKFDIQVGWGLEANIAEKSRSKALWLGERFLGELNGGELELKGIRLQDSQFRLCFTTKGNELRLALIDRDIVDDMCDPEKPSPETRAKFKALLKQQTSFILRKV